MFWFAIVIIAIAGIFSDMYSRRLKHRERTLKIEAELIQNQMKLEMIKQENYKLETEKLRLELSKDYERFPTKEKLLETDLSKK